MKSIPLRTIILLIISLPIQAEIILDGTLGRSGALSGPDYLIKAELGQQHGGNLFHSFQDFNVQSFESASFSGPNTVNNIISRVTGGKPSQIDGLLRSTIPNADLYFLNPYGILFGSQAQLDIQGSFHASTADYLRLENGGQFNARHPKNSLLSVAPVEAFGFLTNTPAPLSIQGSQLATPPGKTLSLISGDLTITEGQLKAPGGQINLASLASQGELMLTENGLEASDFNQFGELTFNNAQAISSGKGSGNINIRAGQFTLNQSKLKANSLEPGEKGWIDIQVNRLNLKGNELIDTDKKAFDAIISSSTISDGEGGDIRIKATDVTLSKAAIFADSGKLEQEESRIASSTVSQIEGHAGTIYIEADRLIIDNGAIESNAFGIGQGGNITLYVSEYISAYQGHIAVNAFEGSDVSADRVGTILVETGQLDLSKVTISSSTFGTGAGGNITLKVDGLITLSQGAILVDAKTFNPPSSSNERNSSQDNNGSIQKPKITGHAGTILIEAKAITLTDKSKISSSTSGSGDGGNVQIYARDAITIQNTLPDDQVENPVLNEGNSGIEAVSTSQEADSGHAGEIWIETQHLSLSDKVKINTSNRGGGDAGNIHLKVTNLDLSNNATIASTNRGSGNAGNISLQVQDQLHLQNAYMTTEAKNAQGGDITLQVGQLVYSQDSRITTSVRGGSGDGGNITLQTPEFIILDDAQIKAQANTGRGGNISLISNQFIASPCSLVSASSRLGIDGNVEIDSPTVNMDEFMVVLPTGFTKASLTKCDIQALENPSTFKIRPRFHALPFMIDSL